MNVQAKERLLALLKDNVISSIYPLKEWDLYEAVWLKNQEISERKGTAAPAKLQHFPDFPFYNFVRRYW